MEIPLILSLIIAVLIIALGVFVLYKRQDPNYRHEPDYRAFFIVGITWLPLGIATENIAFLGIGVVFMILGLTNRNKWKDHPRLSELPLEQRRLKMFVVVGLTALLLLGVLAYIIAKNS